MATLAYCLKKLGLSDAHAKLIEQSSVKHKTLGMSAAEAALTSVEDMLKLLDKDRTEILAQAEKAGFVPPEKEGVLEYEAEPSAEPELLPEDHPQVQELAKLVVKQEKLVAGKREAGIEGWDLNETLLDLANMKRAWQLFREGKQERDVFQDLMNNYPEIAAIFKEKPPEKALGAEIEKVHRIEFKGVGVKEGKEYARWVPVEVDAATGKVRIWEEPVTMHKPISSMTTTDHILAADKVLPEGFKEKFGEFDTREGFAEFDYNEFIDMLQKEGIEHRFVPTEATITDEIKSKITETKGRIRQIREYQHEKPKARTMTIEGEKFTIKDELKRLFTRMEDLQKGIDPEKVKLPADAKDIKAFTKQIEKTGAAIFNGVHYKIVPGPVEGTFHVERVTKGIRQTITGEPGEDVFPSLEEAQGWAMDNAGLYARKQKPAKEPPEAKSIAFSSGASRINDLKAHIDEGWPVGVSVAELTEPATKALESYAAAGGEIFMDSGVYQGLEPDWEKTFEAYRRINKAATEPIKVVAPDVFGDQVESLEALRTHKKEIRDLLATDANVVVPLHLRKGTLGPADVYGEAIEILGHYGFTPGIPSVKGKKEAWTDDEVLKFLKDSGAERVHFLGLGEEGAPRVKAAIKQLGPENVTMDATLLRKTPKMKGITKRRKGERHIVSGEEVDKLIDRGDLEYQVLFGELLNTQEVREVAEFLNQDPREWIAANQEKRLGDLVDVLSEDLKNEFADKVSEILEAREFDKRPVRGEARRRAVRSVLATEKLKKNPELLTKEDLGTVFVACCDAKLPEGANAKELYQSDLFKKSRALAEQKGEDWKILSAEHGVVHPDQYLTPYDKTLNKMKVDEKKKWAANTAKQIAKGMKAGRITILGGVEYRKYLKPQLEARGFDVFVPMEGLNIGQQLSWLKRGVEGPGEPPAPKVEEPVIEDIEIPAYTKERTTFAPGTKERAKLLDEPLKKLESQMEALDKKISELQTTLDKTRSNAHKKRAALRKQISEVRAERDPLSRQAHPMKEQRWRAMLEDAQAKPRDEAQRLAVEVKLLEMDKGLTDELAGKYRKGIQQLALKETKRQGVKAEDQQGVAMDYANNLMAQPLSDTYELQPHVEILAKSRDHQRWLPEAEAKIEAMELQEYGFTVSKSAYLRELRDLSIWDEEKAAGIIKEAKVASKEFVKEKRKREKKAALAKEAAERVNAEVTLEGETIKGQKDQLDKFLDKRIKERKAYEKKIEGTDKEDLPPGMVTIKVGPATYNIDDDSATLTKLRKKTGIFTGKPGFPGDLSTTGKPTSYKAPPAAPKIPMQNLAKKKYTELVKVEGKPKGGLEIWTDGRIAALGEPPKGSKQSGRTAPYSTVKDIWEQGRKKIAGDNLVVGNLEFTIDYETGKPTDYAVIRNMHAEGLAIDPQYLAWFRVNYPKATFYFKLDKEGGSVVAAVDGQKMVGMFMSRVGGTEISADVERGKVPIEVDVKKNYGGSSGRGYASYGEYATAGEHAAPLQSVMGLPEMVQLAKELLGGKYPIVKRKLRRRDALGLFYHGGLQGRIELLADIFKDPAQAAAVLAHEIGHLVDWLPDKTMKRGNILGRIASLKAHLKHTMPRAPGAAEELTEKDRRRLRYQAEKFIKEQFVDKWIDEVIREELPIDPDDVLAIWNAVEDAKLINPELYNFIAGLSTAEKKAIVKEAMKGITHDSLAQFAKVVETPTGKKIQVDIYEEVTDTETGEVKKRIKEEYRQKISEKYASLINEEIEKLRLFHVTEVMDELKSLTRAWKPFDPAANPEFTKYRYSGVELYADAISVLINAPGLLKSMAPNFYEGFFNYLDNKPEVKEIYNDIQDIIRAGIADDVIVGELHKNMRKGEQIKRDAIVAQKKKLKSERWEAFMRHFFDADWTLHKHIRAVGEGNIPPEKNPRFKMEDMHYTGSEVEWLLTRVKARMVTVLEQAGLNWDDFGLVRKLRRIVGEVEEPKAGEEGLTPERAQKILDSLRANREPEQNRAMRMVNKEFEELGQYIIEKGKEAKYWSPELIEVMEDNLKYYSTIDVLEWYEKRFGRPVAAKIFPRVGTLKGARNPATATIEKYIAMVSAINRKVAGESVVNFLNDFVQGKFGEVPKEFKARPVIRPATRKWNGKFMEIQEPPAGTDEKLLVFLHEGKAKGYYVHKWLGDMFEKNPVEQVYITKILRALAHPMRMIFTEANPGFMLFNMGRDYQNAVKKLPGARMFLGVNWVKTPEQKRVYAGFWKKYIESIKPAQRSIFGIPDDVVAELQKGKGLISVANYRGLDAQDVEIERMLARYKLEPMKYRNEITKPFVDMFVWLTNVGRVIERIPKIAGYKHLKEMFPEMDDATLMHMVRWGSGSPAFLRKGRGAPWYNSLLLYSNAQKEGVRAEYDAAEAAPLEYAWKHAKYTIIPKMVMMAGAMGALGLGAYEVFKRVPSFDMTNYNVIPLGLTPNNKAVYLRLPQDEMARLIGGIMWKIYEMDEPKYWANLLDYMSGQAPTMNPMLESIFDAGLYALQKNPYDPFRGKYALPEQLFKAYDKRTHKAFAKYIANQLGASIIYRFQTDDLDEIRTTLEKGLQYPLASNIIGRFLKVSSGEERREYRVIQDMLNQTDAREILDAREVVVKMVNGEPITPEDEMKLARRPMVVEQNMLVKMARRYGFVFLDSFLSATTVKAQVAIWQHWRDRYRLENPNEDITWLTGIPELVNPPKKREKTPTRSLEQELEPYREDIRRKRGRRQPESQPMLGQ